MTTLQDIDRDTAIKAIRSALQKRSGKAWSVTGGRGTAWGWIRVEAPPRRRTWRYRLKAGATTSGPGNYEPYDSGEVDGYMSPADCAELAELLGLERVSDQGESIPAGRDYYAEYVARARGATPAIKGKPYWD